MRTTCRILSVLLLLVGGGGTVFTVVLVLASTTMPLASVLTWVGLLIPGVVLGAFADHLEQQERMLEQQSQILTALTNRAPAVPVDTVAR